MSSYAQFVDKYKVNITENDTNTIVEMTINSVFFQELFLTKKEKDNNRIYDLLVGGGVIISIFACLIPSFMLDNNLVNNSSLSQTDLDVFIDMFREIFKYLFGGCLSCTTLIILILISMPFYMFLEQALVTKIKDVKLTFSSNGLEINPNTKNSNKEPIFIDSLNIKEICIREQEIKRESEHNSYIVKILNIIVVLQKSIEEQFTNKEIKEIAIIEEIDKKDLEQAIKLAETLKKALKLSV